MNDVAEVERLFAKGWHTPHDEPSYANFSAIDRLTPDWGLQFTQSFPIEG